MITEITEFQQVMWAVNTAAQVFLLILLAMRKNYRAYPGFAFYIFVNLCLNNSLFLVYRQWGYSSTVSWFLACAMQTVTVCARGFAVAEVCRHFLSRYPGIWALSQRLLIGTAGLVLVYSGFAARHQWQLAFPSVERGLELAIATVIVVLFLFTRYYHVRTEGTDRSLAIGFCLYSCFRVLNDTVADRYLHSYAELWSVLGMLAYFASLLLWSWALWKPRAESAADENLLPTGVYQSAAPQINLRLRSLNDQLNKIWKAAGPRN